VTQAKEALPFMKWELSSRGADTDRDLAELGEEVPSSEVEQRNLLLRLASQFGQVLRRISGGDYRDETTLLLAGGTNSSIGAESSSSGKGGSGGSSSIGGGDGVSGSLGTGLRAKYLVGEITRDLQQRIDATVPDFDSETYAEVRSENRLG
jgi:hypothetical protein